jgi:carotenoid cleavage dioxygenase-like enzyme
MKRPLSLSMRALNAKERTYLQPNRRDMVKALSASWIALSLGPITGCGDEQGEDDQDTSPPLPSLRALNQGVTCPLDLTFTAFEGTIPDLDGYAFVMGPIPWGDGTPIFNGDGALMRFNVQSGEINVKTRRVLTPCALLDDASKDTPFAYKNRAMIRESSAFGARNFLNTAPIPTFDGRLMATYDAGRPWEISPDNLELTTPLGTHEQWRPMIPPLTDAQRFQSQSMSTAHPTYDPHTREMFSVNFAPLVPGLSAEPFFDVMWWGDDGVVKRAHLIDEEGEACIITMSCHQMHVTEHYVILIDSAVLVEPEQLFGQDVTRPQSAVTPIWVVPRAELNNGQPVTAQLYTVPCESAHFLAAYDDSEGLELLLVHQCSSDPSEWVRLDDRQAHNGKEVHADYVGLPVSGADRLWLGKYRIHPERGEVELERSLHGDELWGITLWTQDPRVGQQQLGEGWWVCQGWRPELYTERIMGVYQQQDHRTLQIDDMPSEAQPPRILRIDHQKLEIIDEYILEDGYVPLSPTFLPASEVDRALTTGEGSGAVLTLVQGPEGSELWFFDALDIAKGPIAKARHDELVFGFTLHSAWLPSLTPPEALYTRSVLDELSERFSFLDQDARSLAENVLQSQFL